MIASRRHRYTDGPAPNTACPPRRSAGSSQAPTARRRGQACPQDRQESIAFGAELPTPAIDIAGVDNTVGFSLIVAG